MTPDEARAFVDALSPDELMALEEMRRAEEQDRRDHPMRYARLWDNPLPKTSQARPLRESLGADAIALVGGNGSGKTEAGAQLATAAALGRDHPDARAWCEANGIPPEMLPPYPGRVLASSLTSNESRRVQRMKVKKYLPAGCKWRNESGDGEAEVVLPGGGAIVFKSNDQKARAYQADEFDIIWPDEEHDEDVIGECFMRLNRRPWRGGYILFTMTPLKGLTWVHRDFVAKPKPGHVVWYIHGADNPYADQEWRKRVLQRYGPHEQAARDRGEFTALEGRVYVDWRRDLHVRRFELAPQWPRFMATDWGTSVPTAIGYAGYDESNDVVYLRRMVYRPEMTISDRAQAIREIEATRCQAPGCSKRTLWDGSRYVCPSGHVDRVVPVERRWVDPEDASTNRTLIRDYDIQVVSAHKAINYGINVVATRLRPDALGRPHLIVHPDCEPFIREIEGYVRKGDGTDAVVKKNDHACDMVRYLCVGIARVYGLRADVDDVREAA